MEMKMDIGRVVRENITNALRVLEIGSGSGTFLRELAEEYPAVSFVGIDPFSQESKNENLEFISLRAEDICQIPGWFDIIFSIHSFHHIQNPEAFLNCAQKKISGMGKLIILDWDKLADTGIPEDYYSIGEITSMAKKAGFLPVDVSSNGEENLFIFSCKEFNVAVASDDGTNVFKGMFGRAKFLYVYKIMGNEYEFVKRRRNIYSNTFQHLKTYDVYSLVNDCSYIITGNIGKRGEVRLKGLGVHILKVKGGIEESIKNLLNR